MKVFGGRRNKVTGNRRNFIVKRFMICYYYGGADKSLARPTSRCILFGGENISFDARLVLYIYK
jgi:hypothetical protein